MPSNEVLSLMTGALWSPVSQPASISYTIIGESGTDQFGRPVNTVNATFQQAVAVAVAEWNKVANINMHFVNNSTVDSGNPFATKVEDIGMIFRMAPLSGGVVGLAEYTGVSGNTITGTTITMDNLFFTPSEYLPDTVSFAFQVLLHEIGHALGLAHPDDGSSYLTISLAGNDLTQDGTVMNSVAGQLGTETTISGQAFTPMIHDIAALQYMYGANRAYNAGNTSYSFAEQKSATIWDGGGIDVINQSASTSAVTLDLGEGIDNVSAIDNARIWIAAGANIENALGGSADDTITGNTLANRIHGNSGDDTIDGLSGSDFLQGNRGADSIVGGDGQDTLRGGKDNDTLSGDAGHDVIWGDLGDDSIVGGTGIDRLKGGAGNDTLDGGDGIDELRGGQGNDSLSGGDGNDTLHGDRDDDTLVGGAGNDVFVFALSAGNDTITDFEAAGTVDILQFSTSLFATAAAALAAVSVVGGDSVIDLGASGNVTVTGITTLAIDDFIIA